MTALVVWAGVQAVQVTAAVRAFKMDGEPLRVLWLLPLQQVVYRQLMYAVLIRSLVTAATGSRLRWHKLHRTGDFGAAPALGPVPGPAPVAVPLLGPAHVPVPAQRREDAHLPQLVGLVR